jgi:hypothetical protein
MERNEDGVRRKRPRGEVSRRWKRDNSGSGAGWTGSVSATSEAAMRRGSAPAGGAGGVGGTSYNGKEAGCGDSTGGGKHGRSGGLCTSSSMGWQLGTGQVSGRGERLLRARQY